MRNLQQPSARQSGLILRFSRVGGGPLRRGLLGAGRIGLAVIALVGLAAGPRVGWAWAIAAGGFVVLWAVVARQMRKTYPHDRIGACNLITLIRAALALSLVATLPADQAAGWRGDRDWCPISVLASTSRRTRCLR